MKPSDYKDYAGTIDILSSPKINEDIDTLIKTVVSTLPMNASLLDIGGGTGSILSKILMERADVSAVMVEPSPDMFRIAEGTFLEKNADQVHLIHSTFQEAYEALPVSDGCLFCRSLYSFSGDLNDYEVLFEDISTKLSAYGHLFILEPKQYYDIASCKQQIQHNIKNTSINFEQHWPIMKMAMQRFNDGVSTGEFMLFDENKLIRLANRHGFNTKFLNDTVYVFRKSN